MDNSNKEITVTYDEKRYRFNTTKIESLNIGEEHKIKLKELFDVFSKNRTYVRLIDAHSPKCAIIVIAISVIFSIVFLALATSNESYNKEGGHGSGLINSVNFDDLSENVAKNDLTGSDLKSSTNEKDKTIMKAEDDEKYKEPMVGDPNDLTSPSGIMYGYADNTWRREKDATYWILFILSLMIFIFTTLLLISHQVRNRRQYQALEKYELNTIGDYMPYFKDTFTIRRIHRRKKIFKYCNCMFSFRFGYEVQTLKDIDGKGRVPRRRSNNDYHVDTETELNVTGELDQPQYNSQIYQFKDTETGNLFTTQDKEI